jgi:hypothetical protein
VPRRTIPMTYREYMASSEAKLFEVAAAAELTSSNQHLVGPCDEVRSRYKHPLDSITTTTGGQRLSKRPRTELPTLIATDDSSSLHVPGFGDSDLSWELDPCTVVDRSHSFFGSPFPLPSGVQSSPAEEINGSETQDPFSASASVAAVDQTMSDDCPVPPTILTDLGGEFVTTELPTSSAAEELDSTAGLEVCLADDCRWGPQPSLVYVDDVLHAYRRTPKSWSDDGDDYIPPRSQHRFQPEQVVEHLVLDSGCSNHLLSMASPSVAPDNSLDSRRTTSGSILSLAGNSTSAWWSRYRHRLQQSGSLSASESEYQCPGYRAD